MKNFQFTLILLIIGFLPLHAQKQISGVVKDSDGIPLIGVNVTEKGTSNGTITDLEGAYSLSVSDDATLVFSLVGFTSQELLIGDQSTLNVSLDQGVALDEVVVTALGIEKDKKALAFSVTEVGGENMEAAREANIGNSLAGKVAGLSINRTATGIGGSTRITIRGNSSISGNNQPLIVVDGVPIDNSNLGSAGMWGGQDWGDGISSINPSDVESMTVLKGNTAAALYGYRAANGVILVKTKSGSARKGLSVELNSNYQADQLINTFDFQNEYGHGNRGLKPTTAEEALAFGLQSWGARLDGSPVLQFDGETRPYSDVGDNINRFYRTGNTFNNNISISGGTDALTYRLSGTAMNNQDIIPNSGLDRYTFTFNSNAKVNERLSATVSASYLDERAQNRPRLSDSPGNANYTVQSLPASIDVETLRGNTDKLGADANGFELQFNDNVFVTNPYWAAYQWEANSNKNRIFGHTSVSYSILENLQIRGKLSIDRFDRRQRNYEAYGTAFTNFGGLNETNLKVQELNRELILDYSADLTESVGLSIILGGNQQRNFLENLGAGGGNLSIPFLGDVRNVGNIDDRYSFSEYAVNSLFGQAEVSLLRSLYLTGSLRQDVFSTLTQPDGSDSDNSKLYYGVGASWVFSDMLSLPTWVDFGKLRLGYAQVGGATDPYQLTLAYGVFGVNAGQPLGGISSGTIPNGGLVPSTSNEFEIGADIRLFQNRVGLDIAYYDRTTVDDILSASASIASGYGSRRVNVGEIKNSGVELLLNVTPVRTRDFEWTASVNFAQNNNVVVSLVTPENDGEMVNVDGSRTLTANIQHIEGLPYSQITGFRFDRDASGNIKYDDQNLPIRKDSVVAFGTGVHPTMLGINNSFKFGNFRVSALIDMRAGGFLYTATNSFAYSRGFHKNTLAGREDGNVGPVTLSDPANVQDYYQRIAGITEEFVQESTFAKLREVIVSYTVPSDLLSRANIKGATIGFAARNLLLLYSSIENVDPESTYSNGNAQGLEMFGVPQTRSYGLNLNLKF